MASRKENLRFLIINYNVLKVPEEEFKKKRLYRFKNSLIFINNNYHRIYRKHVPTIQKGNQ